MSPLLHSLPQTDLKPAGTALEVQLCVMVAPTVRAKVHATAKARGLTMRALVLSALRDAGVLEEADGAECTDRRATVAAAKARLWREHMARSPDIATVPDASPPCVEKAEGRDT